MSVRTRFAPSPTGLLHVGNARVALINWLLAKAAGGRFLLRIDDTDTERSEMRFEEAIREDLEWLGLAWDEEARQSDRLERYEAAADHLRDAGRLYPCYETPEELALKRKAQLSAGRPPRYDRAALRLGDAERAAFEAAGRKPHWRFLLNDAPIEWDDRVRGQVHFEGAMLSDPVLVREDGRPLYTLSSVVDDIDLGVTLIVRGEDHVTNTAAQIQLFEALGGAVPAFGHLSLLADKDGKGLSKRLGSLSLGWLREDAGIEAMAVNSHLSRLGSALPVEPFQTLEALADGFSLDAFGRATPRFDPDELVLLNARLLHERPFDLVRDRLHDIGLEGADERFWLAVRGNLETLADAEDWWRVCHGQIQPVIEEPDYVAHAASLLPKGDWTEETWKVWTDAVKQATGRKGKALFMPLRLALTGRPQGPEMTHLLPLIGRKRAQDRLREAA